MPSIYVGSTKIKNIYAGTTKIKKVYAGTTLVWSSQIIKGTAAALVTARQSLAGASIGDYALFAGGQTGTSSKTATAATDSYNSNLVKGVPTYILYSARDLVGANNTNYAFFGGGSYYDEGTEQLYNVNTYNASLVRSSAANFSSVGSPPNISLSSSLRAFFPSRSALDYYNNDAVKGSISFASAYFYDGVTTSLSGSGVYAIFADVASTSVYSHAYNISSMVRTTITDLPTTAALGTHIGQYALFSESTAATTGRVYAYSDSLVLTTPISTITAGHDVSTTFGGYALFIGGYNNIGATTDAIDSNLILSKTAIPGMTYSRGDSAIANIKDSYTLIAGGYDYTTIFSTVEYYGY